MDTVQILLCGDIFHFSDIVCAKYKEKLYSCEPSGFGDLLDLVFGFFSASVCFPMFHNSRLGLILLEYMFPFL